MSSHADKAGKAGKRKKKTADARYTLLALFGLALAVRLLTAWLLDQPGYTDAYYYAVGAKQLHAGQGFDEPFIWNYLEPPVVSEAEPPDGVPHAGYAYWLPLTALLGWLGMALFGDSFGAIQMPFVVISALLPLVAYAVAWDLTGQRKHALLAGLLAVFPGFYAHMFVLSDNFAPFALAGSVCLWAAGRGLRDRRLLWFGLAGLAAGLAHLSRADGLLLLGVAAVAALFTLIDSARRGSDTGRGSSRAGAALGGLVLVVAGYLLVMGPWFVRNWLQFGAPISSAGTQTLFLTTYDDMFAFGRPLTLAAYLDWGWEAILKSKWEALLLNAQRLWIENLLIVLLPFSALGLWRYRRERLLWPFFLYLPLLFLAMTFAFTFPGMRGGLFHSGGALLPVFFAAAGPGLEVAVRWAARRLRGWRANQAWKVFSAGLVGMAILLTVFALWRAGAFNGEWNARDRGYAEIGAWLAAEGVGDAVVMVGNAPGFTWHTGQRAIAVPNEPLDTILSVADLYSARYLVLDEARTRPTDDLYALQASHPRLALVYTFESGEQAWQLYEIRTGSPK